MEITLCLIVKNEEKKLPACLQSFQGVFDKLVIVDTGSTDKTIEVAKDFGAVIWHFPWIKNFSAARNFALSKVDTAWTMMVDADDTLDSRSREQLIAKLKNLPSGTSGISLPYLYSNVRNGRGTMAFIPRIWRTNLQLTYTLPIHEYLNIPQNILKSFVRLEYPILHNKSDEDFSKSFLRNIDILENAYARGERHPRVLFYLGHDNFYAEHAQASLEWFNKFLRLRKKHPHEAFKAHMLVARIHLKNGDRKAAKKSYRKAIKTCQQFLEPHILLGNLAMEEKKYSTAVKHYSEALFCIPPHTHIFLNTHLNYAYAEGKLYEALAALEKKKPL